MTVCSSRPFALSLSKGQAEPVEDFVLRVMGFDRLSPNGSLRTLNFGNGPQAEARFMHHSSRAAQWSN
jgi:hypothetical protein